MIEKLETLESVNVFHVHDKSLSEESSSFRHTYLLFSHNNVSANRFAVTIAIAFLF